MMRNLDQFNYLKRPMIVAISRKGFGKQLFGLAKDDRLDVTLIAESYMYLHGGRVLRVHDVKETKQLVKMLDDYQWLLATVITKARLGCQPALTIPSASFGGDCQSFPACGRR